MQYIKQKIFLGIIIIFSVINPVLLIAQFDLRDNRQKNSTTNSKNILKEIENRYGVLPNGQLKLLKRKITHFNINGYPEDIKFLNDQDEPTEDDLNRIGYTYQYNQKGNLIESKEFFKGLKFQYITQYQYDDTGKISQKKILDSDQYVYEIWTYDYEIHDKQMNILITDADLHFIFKIVQIFDQNDQVLVTSFYDTENELINDDLGVAKYIFQYDDQQRLVSHIMYNSKAEYAKDYFVIPRWIFIYDIDGNLSQEIGLFGSGGLYKKTVKTWSSDFHLQEESYYVGGGNLLEDDSGNAQWKMFYDQEGLLTQKKGYNKNKELNVKFKYYYNEKKMLSKIEKYVVEVNFSQFNEKLEEVIEYQYE